MGVAAPTWPKLADRSVFDDASELGRIAMFDWRKAVKQSDGIRRQYPIPDGANVTLLLVDVDNLGNLRGRDQGCTVDDAIRDILSRSLDGGSGEEYVVIRLYGGWFDGEELSRAASDAMAHLLPRLAFPLVVDGRLVRGRSELAKALLAVPSLRWSRTVVFKDGLPPFKIRKHDESGCSHRSESGCAWATLRRLRNGKTCAVAACDRKVKDCAEFSQQKLVDCLLSLDTVDSAADAAVHRVLVMSDDRDIVPGVVRAAIAGSANVELWTSNARAARQLEPVIGPYGLSIRVRD